MRERVIRHEFCCDRLVLMADDSLRRSCAAQKRWLQRPGRRLQSPLHCADSPVREIACLPHPRMSETSFSLLNRLRLQPDAESWRRLVDLYTPLIQGWLRRHAVPAADADDLTQEVMAVVVRELPQFNHNQQRGAFRNWLRTITVNRLRVLWRSRQTRPQATGTAISSRCSTSWKTPRAA